MTMIYLENIYALRGVDTGEADGSTAVVKTEQSGRNTFLCTICKTKILWVTGVKMHG